MIGKTVSHYHIVSQLGSGGMGVVYEARDERLGRSVALKFVPDDLARDEPALRRLRAEARTASSLSHPNICTIHDIDESDGRPFIVMELLKGYSLRERLGARSLRVHEVVDLGIHVADALDYAHTHGIIHRDIKPANLFLGERGQVKIVDFGLAKLVRMHVATASTIGAGDLTATGQTLGTVAYMSPEQVTGEELDGRTDIFSFGVVLYECVTGHQPFSGKTAGVVLSAILNKAPVAPATFNPDLPPRLQDVINNCLEKDRELRYQSAADLRADLRRIRRDLESGQSRTVSAADASAASAAVLQSSRSVAASRQSGSGGIGARPWFAVAVPVALLALVAGVVGLRYWPGRSAEPVGVPSTAPPGAAPSTTAPAAAATPDPLVLAQARLQAGDSRAALAQAEEVLRSEPDRADAIRIRDQAREMLSRFDAAVARARTALDAGNLDAASGAIDAARSLDPSSPIVGGLSARLIAALRSRPTSPTTTPLPRASRGPQPLGQVASPPAAAPEPVAAPPPVALAAPPPQAPAPQTAPLQSAAEGTPAAASPAPQKAPETTVAPAPPVVAPQTPRAATAPSATTPVPARGATAPAATAEDDEAAIRRAIATYVRAIESKDVALFKSIKPNTSTEEQRRVEEGFRAVSSQRVAITILAIERRGQEASVRLKRTDTIVAGGRERSSDAEQTMRLTRGGNGWVIRDIGR